MRERAKRVTLRDVALECGLSVSAVSYAVGKGTGKVQTGYLYHYAFVMLLGVAGLLTFALWAWAA